ncbi:MAG: rod-binding protein [Pararhodobacter sp.]|nr:rod-binding protein [Pararhodobacter sp.]
MLIPPETLHARLSGPAPSALRRSAEDLETAFLSEMLKSAGIGRAAESMNGGAGEEHFSSFFADAYARALVARGGIGLADHIERALEARGTEGAI